MRVKVFFGRLCEQHPDLKGERYLSNQRCVECERLRAREYYERRREAVRARQKRYRLENLDFVRALGLRYRKGNKALISLINRQYHEENREAQLARMRKNGQLRRQKLCANPPKPN